MNVPDMFRQIVDDRPVVRTVGPWVVLLSALGLFLSVVTALVAERVSTGETFWYTDFAIFRQAGYLVSHGSPADIYRYVPSSAIARANLPPVWSEFATHHVNPDGDWEGYYYAQAPWQALLMVPFSWVAIETGYLVYTGIMVLSMVVSAVVLSRYTDHGWAWGSLIVLVPLFSPLVVGRPWDSQMFKFTWLVDTKLQFGSALGATLWYGQYTPFLLCLLVGGLVAAYLKRPKVAALLVVVAMMKPTVLFVLPAFLLVLDSVEDHIGLMRWGIIWTVVFNVLFVFFPGYPLGFVDAATSYSDVTVPILLQAHNWVLYFGVPIAAVALSRDGVEVTSDNRNT